MKKITKDDVKARYEEYNRLYFDNKLKHCKFSARKIGALGNYLDKTLKDGTVEGRITITTDVDWTEDGLKKVIIHEMIHHYVRTIDGCRYIDGFSWYGLFGHGRHFKSQIRRLKKEFGLDISIHNAEIYHINEIVPSTLWGKLVRLVDWYIT